VGCLQAEWSGRDLLMLHTIRAIIRQCRGMK
jgi:hypothetical protein